MESKERKMTLVVLCYIFGIFGLHRFYTGKYLTGGLYLTMLVVAGVLGLLKFKPFPAIPLVLLSLWWVVDFMRIIMGKFTDRDGLRIIQWV